MKKVKMKLLKMTQILLTFLMFNLINHHVFALSAPRVQLKLGSESLVVEHVPINAELQLTCALTTPIWYRDEQFRSSGRTLIIDKLKLEDTGLYACYTPSQLHGHKWSNLSLIVVDENEMAIFGKVEDEIDLKLQQEQYVSDELKNYTLDLKALVDTNHIMVDEFKPKIATEMFAKSAEQLSQVKAFNLRSVDLKLKTEIDNDVDINVKESPPKFTKNLATSLHKPSGSSIRISCPATGYPIPNIKWTRNDAVIENYIGSVTYNKWSINMKDVITEDSGAYKCTLCNKLGCIEHTTKLIIIDRMRTAPILSDKYPQNQTVLVNSSAYFKCIVLSDEAVYYRWIRFTSRNNETINELEHSLSNDIMSDNYEKNFVIIPTYDFKEPNVLRLKNVTYADEGWYTCVARNSLGQSVSSAYLKVIDKIPKEEEDTTRFGQPISIRVVTIIVVLLLLMGSILIIYVLRKLKRRNPNATVHQWTKKVIINKPPSLDDNSCDLQIPVIKIEKQRITFQTSTNLDSTQAFNEYEFPLDSNWEIQRSQLTLGSTLGEGAFGRVVMAEAIDLPRSVAVKMVKEDHTDDDIASLVREMELMKMIGEHINIINLLGCRTQNGPLWVIVEFAPHGNLKDFLKKNRPLSMGNLHSFQRNSGYVEPILLQLKEKHLISFAFQIARGMEYLSSRKCIHRDLAARNILVSDDYVMKIADFGLARDVQDSDYYRKKTNGRLPIKWMAPESLEEMFYDSQSDVWSYGVLLWEIMTYGKQPYPNIMSAEELYSYLISGQRMEKPSRCSLTTYMLMHQCWEFNSSARPRFGEIVENLSKMLKLATKSNEEYVNLSKPMIETPPVYSNVDLPPKLSNDKGYLDMTMSISEAPPNDEEYEDMSVQMLEKPQKSNNDDEYLDMSMHILEPPPASSNNDLEAKMLQKLS